MKSFYRVLYYDFSTIIYQFLDINDLLTIAQIFENNIPLSLSGIKNDVWISDYNFGEQLIKFF
jgi:hypothetical protein